MLSGAKRKLVQGAGAQAVPAPGTGEPSLRVIKRQEVSKAAAGVSVLQHGLRGPRGPSSLTERWFDQCVYHWKTQGVAGSAGGRREEVCANEPALLTEEAQEWLLPRIQADGCVWVVDLRFGSLRGGWLAFYKQRLPLCTVPLFLREKSLRESGRAIFERTSLRPRGGSQARESLHFLVAKTENTLTCSNMKTLLAQLRADAGSPAVVFVGWSTHDQKTTGTELRDALAAAAACDEESVFLLRLPEKPTRAQQLVLFLLSSCLKQWRLLFFEASGDGEARKNLIFAGRGVLAPWSAFLRAAACPLAGVSLPASEWLEQLLKLSGLALPDFWSWKAKWRDLHYRQENKRLCCPRADQARRRVQEAVAPEVTVHQWLAKRLPGGARVEDLLYQWARHAASPLVQRSFLWSDQQYTWESSCTDTLSENPKKKWFAGLPARLHKNRPLPPHTFLLLEESRVVVDLLLFPEINSELRLQWTRGQRLRFVDASILPAQALRRKVLAPASPEPPMQTQEIDGVSDQKGWQDGLRTKIAKKEEPV